MSKKYFIIQHEQETPPGTSLDWLEQNHFQYEIIRMDLGHTLPSLDQVLGVIVCGGSMNVDQTDRFSWLADEMLWLKSLIQNKIKVVGLCLGAQLLAKCLGAAVSSMEKWEIGWHPVRSYSGQENVFFHWHSCQFECPNGFHFFGSSETCFNQGFFDMKSCLAFQFHPEVDQSWIDLALSDNFENLQGAVQSKDEVRSFSQIYLNGSKQWYHQQLDLFFKNDQC